MKEEVYEDGEHLIRYGEAGTELYLIRYGKVRLDFRWRFDHPAANSQRDHWLV
jgi:hypothetical protein